MLNPFAFPAETEMRFKLLVAVALALAAMIGFTLTILLAQYGLVDPPYDFGGALPSDATDFHAQETAFIEVIADTLPWLLLPALLAGAVFALAAVLFYLHPVYLRWRKGLQVYPPEQDPEFISAIHTLAGQAGIAPPSIEIGRMSRAIDGQAFGFGKRPALRLGGRMRLLLRKSPERFKAILLHELAHISNRDVTPTYFAIAVWLALFTLGLLPLLALDGLHIVLRFGQTAFGAGGYTWPYFFLAVLPRAFLLAVQVGLLLAVVTASLSGVLRVREQYADWRAALWGTREALADILAGHLAPVETPRRRMLRFWSLHPSPAERLDSLRAPERLFLVSADLPFFAGFLLAFLLAGLVQIGPLLLLVLRGVTQLVYLRVAQWLLPSGSAGASTLLGLATNVSLVIPIFFGVLVFLLGMGYLIAGTVGLQVQRETLAGLAGRLRSSPGYLGLWIPAALLAAGAQFGFFATPSSPLAPLHYSLGSFILLLVLAPVWTAGFAGLVWAWLVYACFAARRFIAASTGDQPSRWRRRLLNSMLGILLWFMLVPAVLLQFILRDLAQDLSYQTLPWLLFPASLVAGLGLYLIIFLLTWFWVRFWDPARELRCPGCGRATRQSYAIGRACEHCGAELSGWLFVRTGEKKVKA